jgi:hypothetical protein
VQRGLLIRNRAHARARPSRFRSRVGARARLRQEVSHGSRAFQTALPWFFSLQRAAYFGTVNDVRKIVAILILVTAVSSLFAQEQEKKLVDRLLKPDMSMTNPDQNKQFATRTGSFSNTLATPTFRTSEATVTKSFDHTPFLSPNEFAVHHFRTGESKANLSTRSQVANPDTVQIAPPAVKTRVAAENDPKIATRAFPESRPFLGQGKSQKRLHAYDRPLTIEEVRELLNKNK